MRDFLYRFFRLKVSGIILLYLALSTSVMAQESLNITRLSGKIEFDGIPGEDTWKTASQFTLTMHKPDFGAKPSENSDIRIGYDDEYLWIGASLYMRDASRIFATTKKRDEELRDYDAFGIILDTYDDNENALAFFTAPTGLRTDFTVSNDAAGHGPGEGTNMSWNTFWDVKTTRDASGWYVEMRIPFSSLKFKPENDIATMGIIISRNISANNETDTYPAIDPKYGFMATNKPSLAQTIKIGGARPTKPIYISPYVLAGFSRDWQLSEDDVVPGYVKNDNPKYNGGIDIKYNINSNLTLDLTANTDFAQVEADDQQVNLTRYSLFFPEKRMFFQERSSLFDFSLGGRNNLFYSRNIGIAGRNQISILGGARLTGRLGRWDMGFLNMQTGEHQETPGENFGVLRMRRQVINENSYVGGIFTSRLGMNGQQNIAYGVDGIFRLYGDDYLNVKWSQTYDSEEARKLNSLDPSFFMLNWQRRSEEGFAYNFNYSYTGEKFTPGTGFIRVSGVQGLNGELMYGWLPGEKSKIFSYNLNLRAERLTRLEDGKLESMAVSPEFELNTKNGIHSSISMEYQEEGVSFDFPLSDSIMIQAGNYSFTGMEARFGTSDSRRISFMAEMSAGQFYDGARYGFRIEPNFNISSSLRLSAMYEFNAIRFSERIVNNSLDIHSMSLRALYMLSTRLSASMMLQYVNTEDELITNFRLRYNPREGNDFYLVFNDLRGVSDRLMIPPRPKFFNKTVMVKYTHTFIL
jgi:hypothetical protein